eukprot:scaffold5201_cov313-Prasinococcus_capsulatus_cf.AAC.2
MSASSSSSGPSSSATSALPPRGTRVVHVSAQTPGCLTPLARPVAGGAAVGPATPREMDARGARGRGALTSRLPPPPRAAARPDDASGARTSSRVPRLAAPPAETARRPHRPPPGRDPVRASLRPAQ